MKKISIKVDFIKVRKEESLAKIEMNKDKFYPIVIKINSHGKV